MVFPSRVPTESASALVLHSPAQPDGGGSEARSTGGLLPSSSRLGYKHDFVLVYFTDVQTWVRKLADGGNIDTMVSELKAQIKTTYSTWEHDRFIEPAIRYFAQA